MKKKILLAVLLSGSALVHAQRWNIHVGGGLNFCRPLPQTSSTPTTSFFKYGFTRTGMYFSPELFLIADDHNQFSFGYQYSNNYIGIKFKGGEANGHIFDILDLHNFSIGYQYNHLIFNSAVNIKAFAKMGIGYGNPVGYGSGSSSGSVGSTGSTSYISYIKLQEDHIRDFWTPTSTVGVGIAPNIKNRWPMDRLSLVVSATVCWRDPYGDFSKLEYIAYENNTPTWGIIKYQGLPFLMQAGIDYNLFRSSKE